MRAGGKRDCDRRDDVALGGRVVAGDDADPAREEGQRALPLGREETFRRELLLEALERCEVRPEPEPLDRERAQLELAALLVELRAPEDVDALAVLEFEAERVELPTRHRDADRRTVRGILQA